MSKFGGMGVSEFSPRFFEKGCGRRKSRDFGGLVGGRDAIFLGITGCADLIHWRYTGVRFSPKSNHSVIIKSWRKGDAFCLNIPTNLLVCSGVLLDSLLE